jgi:HD-GYP domain-containing protein (c-di-GMP phosphodiesterase class II)
MADTKQVQFSDDDFLAVPITSLIHRKLSISDLFVRLETDRMVKVASRGGAVDFERIRRYGENGISYLYVLKEDMSTIVSDLVKGAEGLNLLKTVPSDMRIAKFFNIAESVYVELIELPVTNESLDRAMRLSLEISTTMREKPNFTNLFASIISMGHEFARHSLGTVVVSNLILNQLRWNSQRIVEPVTTAAFFHDIGLKDLPVELRDKPEVQMSSEEAALWKTHPDNGVRLLSRINFIPADVLRIVQEHHELLTGAGFPSRLRQDRIFPLARLVGLADCIAHDMFRDDKKGEKLSLDAIAQKLSVVYAPMYGLDLTRAARKIFRSDDDK